MSDFPPPPVPDLASATAMIAEKARYHRVSPERAVELWTIGWLVSRVLERSVQRSQFPTVEDAIARIRAYAAHCELSGDELAAVFSVGMVAVRHLQPELLQLESGFFTALEQMAERGGC